MNADLVRIVDSISRDKNIEKEVVFTDLEQAMVSAIRKAHGQMDDVTVTIDRLSGEIGATRNGEPLEMRELGRIAAQTAKQVMIQRLREAERGSIFDEFIERKGTVVTGTVSRFEGGAIRVNLGRAEGFLPRSEQIPGESQHPGERIRCLILDVRQAPHEVKIVLSRSHPDFIARLFELEVPEVAERVIEIRALAREAGYRTKIAVSSIDTKVDAVGACVGVRGSRIKNIVVELGGEKIDIVRWNESSQILISNALKPAEVQETALCFELGRAVVVVAEDQLSLAIGKRGQNVRLAARLTGWDIDILTPDEYNKNLDEMERVLTEVEGVDSDTVAKLMALGLISLMDVAEVGATPLVNDVGLEEPVAEAAVAAASEAAKRIAAEAAERKAAAEAASAEAAESGESVLPEAESTDATGSSQEGSLGEAGGLFAGEISKPEDNADAGSEQATAPSESEVVVTGEEGPAMAEKEAPAGSGPLVDEPADEEPPVDEEEVKKTDSVLNDSQEASESSSDQE
jgi:N utilization substance protein A